MAIAASVAACGAAQPRPPAPFDSAQGPRSGRTVVDSAQGPRSARTVESAPTLDAHLFDRVAVIGASVSAGFAAPRIADQIKAGLRAEGAVLDAANGWMFRDAWTDGARQVDAAIAHAPTLTIALDFLFWYAYRPTDPDERAASLERGLAELARIPGPLAVGDIPDMHGASEAILSPAAIPSTDELARMNVRIREWATEHAATTHAGTTVLSLSAWSARLAANERVEITPGEMVEARSLVFVDGLHANALGLYWMLTQMDALLETELHADPGGLQFIR